MIFSNQALHRAFAYKSAYYNKVIFVNFDDGSFDPIKVDDDEWKELDKSIGYQEWHEQFSNSLYFEDANEGIIFKIFANIDHLKIMERPQYIKYKRKVNGEFHSVLMEVLPVENGCYIFVKDLNKLVRGEKEDYGIRE